MSREIESSNGGESPRSTFFGWSLFEGDGEDVDHLILLIYSWLESDDFLELFPQYSKDFLPTVRFGDRVLDATTRSIGRLSLGDLDDVLAVHLRRGGKPPIYLLYMDFGLTSSPSLYADFKQHCPFLFASQSSFTGWNRLVPPPLGLNATSMSSFIEHCYPTVTQMVSSIERHLASRPSNSKPVRTLYVLHDCTSLHTSSRCSLSLTDLFSSF